MITPKTIIVPKGRRIHISWAIVGEDGSKPSLIGKVAKLYYQTGRGRSEGTGVEINGNIITWDFLPEKQFFLGTYHLELKLHDENGRLIVELKYPDAFQLVKTLPEEIEGETTQSDVCNINIKSYVDIVPGLQPADKCKVFNLFYMPEPGGGIINSGIVTSRADEQEWDEDFYHLLDYNHEGTGQQAAERIYTSLLECDAAFNIAGDKYFKVAQKEDDECTEVIAHYVAVLNRDAITIADIHDSGQYFYVTYESAICNKRFTFGKIDMGDGEAIYFYFITPTKNILFLNSGFETSEETGIDSWAGNEWYDLETLRAIVAGLFDVAYDMTDEYQLVANNLNGLAVFGYTDMATGAIVAFKIGFSRTSTNITYSKLTSSTINSLTDNLDNIRNGAAAGATAYQKPSGGIPKTDLDDSTRQSLAKADTALQEHQSLAAYVNSGTYNSTRKKIELKHDETVVAEIDATSFIKDGMVSDVAIVNGNLVISFNTDAGKEAIGIPLTDIFDPANYYNKIIMDSLLAGKVDKILGKGLSSEDYTLPEKIKLNALPTRAELTAEERALDKLFVATYGTTTFSEVEQAYNAGKMVIVKIAGITYILTNINTVDVSTAYAYFRAFDSLGTSVVYSFSKSSGAWTRESKVLDQIYVATRNVTTPEQVAAAVSAGKIVVVFESDATYILALENDAVYFFSAFVASGTHYFLQLNKSTGAWSWNYSAFQKTEYKITSWRNNPDNTHYPSEKLVKDSFDAVPFKIGDGNNSVVQKGGNSAAWGESSVALGKSVTTAEGHDITPESTDAEIIEAWEAAGDEKFALAKGDGASVDGTNCLALGKNSHASGNGTLAKENSANACGTGSKATDKYASARGLETLASGKAADSSGYYTVSSGTGSHSEGKREGISHIEKETFQDVIKSASTESKLYQTLDFSTAADRYEVGYRLWKIANTDSPVSEEDWVDVYDQNIKVTAVYSGGSKWFQLSKKLGIGNKTSRVAIFISSETEVTEYPDVGAKGDGSHIEGISTNALNKGEHGEGCYNKSNQGGTPATNTQHSIGIGSSHNDRKNAVEVMQNGDVYVIGIGGYDGTNAGQAGVLTLQEIINGIVTINNNA